MGSVAALFLSLDYLYFAAPDIDEAIRFYTQALGGTLIWRIRQASTTVAAVRLTESDPLVLLADHLAVGKGLAVYRVRSLPELREQLSRHGWSTEGEPFELPQGPCIVFRDPGQQRLAAYERVRNVDEQFEGRFDR
jgi:catechol 2,3-dioxygenase-like lactoylglutathione lyase family enzyme